ncbi:MAG: serine/threonine-protein kinase [Planctomycetota bacterium]
MRPTDLPEPGEIVDDFLLVERLGQGAFADVWLARQVSLQRMVALKISADAGQEPATLAQLDHPHVVRVFDQRAVPGRDWRLLYMEVVPGGTLDEVIARVRAQAPGDRSGRLLLEAIDEALAQRSEPPPADSLVRRELSGLTWPQTVARLGAELAEALHHAHGEGVLHRDVKPANVLLAANGVPKLADFNIAYAQAVDDAPPEETLGGSVAYMAPEQLRALSPFHDDEAAHMDGRADLYALGVLLVELLAGELPWPERTPPRDGDWRPFVEELLEDRRQAAHLTLPADTPPSLARAVAAALAYEPEARPADGATLARRLRLALHPEVERRVEQADRGWAGFVRRWPTASLLAAIALPSVVLGTLNVLYNLRAVIEKDPAWGSFEQQVGLVNAVAYALGLGLLAWFARPFARAVRADAAGEPATATDVARALDLPRRAACVVLPLWILGGLAFPVWRTLEGGVVGGAAWSHFVVSNVLFGVLAATGAFFNAAAVIVVGALAPVLAPPRPAPWPEDAAQRLERRAQVCFGASVAVPFVSVVANTFMPHDEQAVYLVLGLLGVVAFGLAWLLHDLVRRTLAALRRATAAAGSASL